MILNHALFKGASIQFKDAGRAEEQVGILSTLPVKHVWPNKIYYLPDDDVIWTGRAGGSEYIHNVKRQNGNDTFTPHLMTQVDKLREKGITGKGIKIAVVDTGVCPILNPRRIEPLRYMLTWRRLIIPTQLLGAALVPAIS